ncbi:MAG: sulfatase [Pirellulaceae bacterium]
MRLIICLTTLLVLGGIAERGVAAEQPNVVIIMADDCTFSDLPLYGGKNAKTPNLDALAKEGMAFRRAYLCEAMCQPCRAELYTGLYPMRNGCAWNHSASRPEVNSAPHHLQPLGYRVGLAGKVHVSPRRVFPFERIEGFDRSCTRNPTRPHQVEGIREFMTRDRGKPFCLVVALVEPHVPWVMGDPSRYPSEEIELPPNIADTPRTRADFARYLAEITYMDGQVGDILATVEKAGVSDSTLLLFTSEQGAQFPGCKWTNWDTGVHTALVARWPGKIEAGVYSDAIVQYSDVLPTLLDAAGSTADTDRFDGASFLPVLLGERAEHREFAYAMHNNYPEGPAYPVRSVSDGEFRYIRNLTPEEIYIEKHLMGIQGDGELNNPYWGTWVGTAWKDESTYELVKRYTCRPPEQLYCTAKDPFELENLAEDPGYAERKRTLSAALDRWMSVQEDPGKPQDTVKALKAARQGKHLYGAPAPGEVDE